GWFVDPATVGPGPLDIKLEWTPQGVVWKAIGVSVIGVAVCIGLLLFGGKRRREPAPLTAEPDQPVSPTFASPWPWPFTRTQVAGDRASDQTAGLQAGTARA